MKSVARLGFGGLASLALALLVACGGTEDPVLVVAQDAEAPASPSVLSAVADTEFSFPEGVAELGLDDAATLTFAADAAKPLFSIASGADTASGETTFGSCIFTVTASTFPAGHPLALGSVMTVNPCGLSVNVAGATANGQAVSRGVALRLGSAASAGRTVTVAVTPDGVLTLNGFIAGSVTLTPGTGGSN